MALTECYEFLFCIAEEKGRVGGGGGGKGHYGSVF